MLPERELCPDLSHLTKGETRVSLMAAPINKINAIHSVECRVKRASHELSVS
jgi:hypothetical protein